MLVVNNLSKTYGEFVALENIDLEFSEGVYALLAPNGAGKTTLIKMLSTLMFPTKGEILYDGTDIVSLDDEYRNIIGYLPQDFGCYKSYTLNKFLLYIAALKGIKRKDAQKRVDELLKLVSLEEVADKKIKNFSGGMIQRIGIAQALINDPKILILDEPTAGLDLKERMKFGKLLSNLSKEKIIIVSTHIVSDIEFIAKEVIMIKDRKILYKKSIKNICNTLKGRVYEAEIEFKELEDFREKHIIVSERRESEKMYTRFISIDEESSRWNKVDPTLEDVFLYEYNESKILC